MRGRRRRPCYLGDPRRRVVLHELIDLAHDILRGRAWSAGNTAERILFELDRLK